MDQTFSAVFEDGVLRPLQQVDLAEGARVEVQVRPLNTSVGNGSELSPEQLAKQRAAIATMLAELAALPDEGPDDGFSGRDHDKILYGKP